jgi:hypothetical protein
MQESAAVLTEAQAKKHVGRRYSNWDAVSHEPNFSGFRGMTGPR